MSDFKSKLQTARPALASPAKKKPGRPKKTAPPASAAGNQAASATTAGESQAPQSTVDVSPVIAQLLKAPFSAWAISQQIDGLEISDAEANALAAPIKTLADHYLPQIPEIGWAWVSLGIQFSSVIMARVKLVQEKRKDREKKTDHGPVSVPTPPNAENQSPAGAGAA